MPEIKVIVAKGHEEEVSKTAFTLLYRFTFYSQKFRETGTEQHKNLMLFWEKQSILFLSNPLIKIIT